MDQQPADKNTPAQEELVQEETLRLLARRIWPHFDSKLMVDWGVMMLEKGYDSEGLVILAGLDQAATEDRESYFWLAVSELGLDVNRSDFELLDNYAQYVVKSVLNGDMVPREGLAIMYKLAWETNSAKYMQFDYLSEDLYFLEDDNMSYFTTGLSLENADRFILREFELFLEMEACGVGDEARDSAYCQHCGSVAKPKLKKARNWMGRVKHRFWVCGHCGSKDILDFTDQKGREMILKYMKTSPK